MVELGNRVEGQAPLTCSMGSLGPVLRHQILALLLAPDHEVGLQSRYMVVEGQPEGVGLQPEGVGLQPEGVEVGLDPVHVLQVWPLLQM